jgi:hypothetical protein
LNSLASFIELLLFRIAAEKEKLALEHHAVLEAQRNIAAELKDKLIQAELRHTRMLKEVQDAGEAKLEEAQRDFTDASRQLRKDLGEGARLLKQRTETAFCWQIKLNLTEWSFKPISRRSVSSSFLMLANFYLLEMYFNTFLSFTPELFPDSQPHTHKKDTEMQAKNAVSNPDAPWNAYDHLIALHARLSHMKAIDRHLGEVPEVAIQIFKLLWPGEPVPDNLTLLAQRLKDAGERFGEWRRSSARAGADAALRVACSLYDDLDLDALHSLRGDAPTDTDPTKTAKRRDCAYRVA